jgi:hypothetical protein
VLDRSRFERLSPLPPARPSAAVLTEEHRFILGLDLGQSQDYAALAGTKRLPSLVAPHDDRKLAGRPRRQFRYEVNGLKRWQLKTQYLEVAAEVCRMFAGPPLAGHALAIDATGVGKPVVEEVCRLLRDEVTCPACKGSGAVEIVRELSPCENCAARGKCKPRCRVVPITITPGSGFTPEPDGGFRVAKKSLVSTLVVLFGGERLKIGQSQWTGILTKELENFRVKISASANETFEAWRERDHDDLVLALAIACWVGENATKEFWLR